LSRNVGNKLQFYAASYTRRAQVSFAPPRKPVIGQDGEFGVSLPHYTASHHIDIISNTHPILCATVPKFYTHNRPATHMKLILFATALFSPNIILLSFVNLSMSCKSQQVSAYNICMYSSLPCPNETINP